MTHFNGITTTNLSVVLTVVPGWPSGLRCIAFSVECLVTKVLYGFEP